jgi:hypothetical protein
MRIALLGTGPAAEENLAGKVLVDIVTRWTSLR